MLTQKLLAITNLGAGWVLWLLVALSVVSLGIMLERALYNAPSSGCSARCWASSARSPIWQRAPARAERAR
jgi:hypothetical protein